MFKTLTGVKTLKTLIKLSAVALTSPATVAVASSLYLDRPVIKVIVSTAALILVEGCLLLGWEMLDREGKHATMAQRWLYAGLMWVAYFSLFGIALNHNEGLAGLTFRLTLGVVLIYTSLEAGLLASIKTNRQADRDITKDRRVRRYARRLARQSAMSNLELEHRMRQVDREAEEKLYLLRQSRETNRRASEIENDRRGSVEMAKSGTFLDRANRARRLSKQQALEQTLDILTQNPHASPTDIAVQVGRSRQTVYDYFKELEQAGKIHRNGSGVVAL